MKRFFSLPCLLLAVVAGSLLSGPHTAAEADEVDLRRLLHGPDRCDHVIGLLLRHGVNNDSNSAQSMQGFHPMGPVAIPAADLGDLELISVSRHADAASGCGPSFDLVIKNCSTRDVCGARVTLVALLGRILPTNPNVTVKLDSLPAGQAVQATVTLPIDSLAMGNLNGQTIGMNRVLVVLDSFDQFMESNEANNLRLFELAALPLATAAVAEESATVPADVSAAGNAAAAAGVPTAGSTTAGSTTSDPIGTPTNTMTPTAITQTSAEPASPSDSGAGLSPTDLRSAIDQFTDGASTKQDAS